MAKNATVIASASMKGGTTKSTTIANLGAYLALKHKHVLFIDTDYQADLTSCMNNVNDNDLKKSQVIRVYYHDAKNVRAAFPKDFQPAHVNKYVDLMASCRQIAQVNNIMREHPAIAPYVILHMFNVLRLPQKYDYILIDCHNSFNLLTEGAMVVADYILSPIIPGRFSIKSIQNMIEGIRDLEANLVNPATQQPFVTAKLYFIGNMIDANTKSGQQLSHIVDQNPHFIAKFHRRELVNRATTNFSSVFAQANKEGTASRKIVKNEIEPEFNKILNVINRKKE